MAVELAGAATLVTGAGSGIGRATALAFASRGATVVCVDIDVEAAEKVAVACAERGAPSTSAERVDVADADAVMALAERVHARHGPLDVLVNNAGVGLTGRLTDMTFDDWVWIRSINLDGVVYGCRAFGPAMLERGHGHVVNVSSGLGYMFTATEAAYSTTKAGVLALSRSLRVDWRRSGVGVSAVCPGVINTPIIDRTRFVGQQATTEVRTQSKKAFRRGHRPEKVATAILSAVERDRAVVPVGVEAWLGWLLHRFAPLAAQDAVVNAGRRS
jgi:NAD(P)-dependent dehydrogenase (short-subunit alcohol dehydrogenase family)